MRRWACRSSAPDDVRIVAVEGDGARYWPQWRGPSGQGSRRRRYTDAWSPTSHVQWKVPLPGSGNSSPIVWGDRISSRPRARRGRRLSLLAFNRADGQVPWETFVPAGRRRVGAPEERLRLGHPGHRRPTHLRLVRPARPGRLRPDRQIAVAAQVSASIETTTGPRVRRCSTRTASFLYQDQIATRDPGGVRRRLRQGDREHALADAADGNRRLGHAGRHPRR